jgi:hypothetical protein
MPDSIKECEKLLEECLHELNSQNGLYVTDNEDLGKQNNMGRFNNMELINKINKKIKEISKN